MDLWETKMEIAAAAAQAAETTLLETGLGEWFLLEDAVARTAWIVGTFQGEAQALSRGEELLRLLPSEALGRFETRCLPDADWKTSYRDHFKAWTFGRLHWVPVWERESFRLPAGDSVLWLDPGMAFGTGNHETTRLCIERLVEFEEGLAGGSGSAADLCVIDAGCGSGILALSAFLLGFRRVSGFDNDPEAIRVSIENAELNGLQADVRFETAALPGGLGNQQAAVVLANIQADILIRNATALAASVAPAGLLAMSGILSAESDSVRDAFAPFTPGWSFASRRLGEWCDIGLRRPPL
jgi:ribosomal protein L11 methyltransferase